MHGLVFVGFVGVAQEITRSRDHEVRRQGREGAERAEQVFGGKRDTAVNQSHGA
jgi:hypothetical protein